MIGYRDLLRSIAYELEDQGLKDALMEITFKEPIPSELFEEFASIYKLKVRSFEFDATDDTGRVIFGGGGSQYYEGRMWEEFTKRDLTTVIENIKNADPIGKKADNLYILNMIGSMTDFSVENYSALNNDPMVFLADILPAKVKKEVEGLPLVKGLEIINSFRLDLTYMNNLGEPWLFKPALK